MNIKEIAKLANVSVATVSRYLNNGYVAEEKKQIIKQIIDETGYIPSTHAKILRTRKTNIIGIIVPKISSEAVSRMVDGMSNELDENDYNLLLGNTDLNTDKELKYLNIFKNNQVDGIIFIGTIFTKEHMKYLSELDIPIVILGQKLKNYSCIYHDDFGAANALTELLIKNNCKTIAFIGVTQSDKAAGVERKKGYLNALNNANLVVDNSIIKYGEFSSESGYYNAKEIFLKNPKVDGLFCATDNIAIGAMKYLKEQNINVPKNIKIVSIGDSKLSRIISPKLTSAHYYYKTAGIEAAKMLLNQLKSGKSIIDTVKLSFEVYERETTINNIEC